MISSRKNIIIFVILIILLGTILGILAKNNRFPWNFNQLESENGNVVYEVGIELQQIYVDAGNGKVLLTKTITQENTINDDRLKSSIQIPNGNRD